MPYGWRNPPAPAGGEQNQGRGVTGVKGGSRTGRQQAVSRRLAFLLAASQSVAARLDEDDALDAFARIAVTAMADLCIIDVRDVDGGLRRAAVAHADRDVEASVREALRRWPPDPTGRHPAAEALRTGQTQRADELPPGLLDTPTPDPDAARLLPELGLCSYLAVPLTARGHTLGTVLLSGTTGRAFGPDDVDVAEDVAQLAALAVDNARLVADERAAREGAEAARARVSLLAEATSVLTETLDPNAALERLAERSDYVSVHTLLNTETRHLIGEKFFARMKPTALLINTSRGPVVDERALIRALQDRRLAGAALDVWEDEPIARDNPLLAMDNVVATPHAAYFSTAAVAAIPRRCGEEIARVLTGQRPLNVVNPEVYAPGAVRRAR